MKKGTVLFSHFKNEKKEPSPFSVSLFLSISNRNILSPDGAKLTLITKFIHKYITDFINYCYILQLTHTKIIKEYASIAAGACALSERMRVCAGTCLQAVQHFLCLRLLV